MLTKQVDLIINKLSMTKYLELSSALKINPDELYLVNDENLDAYNQRITHVAKPTVSSDAANKQYVDEEIEKIPRLSAATQLNLGGIKIGYSTSNHNYAVQLDANNKAYVNVPWTDVAISSARYDSTTKQIILVFNDSTKTALSVNVADLVDTYTAGTGLKVENNVFSVSADYALNSNVSSKTELKNEFAKYLLSGDYANSSDLTRLSTSLSNYYTKALTNALSTSFRNGLATTESLTAYETKNDLTANYYKKTETSSSQLISGALSNKVSTTTKVNGKALSADVELPISTISVDGIQTSEFLFKHVSDVEYAQILKDGALSNALYVVSSENQDMYGQRVVNVAHPVDLSDAVNKEYVDALSNTYQLKGNYLTSHQSLSNYYTKSQVSSATLVNTALAGKQPSGDYATKSYAATVGPVTSVNNKTGVVSVYVPTKVSEFTNDAHYISSAPTIRLDSLSTDELNVVHISRDEYAAKVKADDGSILSNTIYILSSTDINAYGQQVKNLADPTDLSDAMTLGYANGHYLSAHLSLSNYYTKALTNSLSATFRRGLATIASLSAYETKNDLTANYYKKTETSSATLINSALSLKQPIGNYISTINGGYGISVDGNTVGLSVFNTSISVDGSYTPEFITKHISMTEYALVLEEGALSNALYVVSSDENDMMGERVINVADPVELSDAVNKKYVDNTIDKYTLASATLSECDDGLSCQISNYTITTISITDPDTPISVILPEQTVDNKVRDFMIRFENTGSENASVAFVPYGLEDIDYEGEDGWADIEPGVNLVSFTETKR